MSNRSNDQPPTVLNEMQTYQASDGTLFHVTKTEEDPEIGGLYKVRKHHVQGSERLLQGRDGSFREHGINIESNPWMTWPQILDSL